MELLTFTHPILLIFAHLLIFTQLTFTRCSYLLIFLLLIFTHLILLICSCTYLLVLIFTHLILLIFAHLLILTRANFYSCFFLLISAHFSHKIPFKQFLMFFGARFSRPGSTGQKKGKNNTGFFHLDIDCPN